MFSILALLSNDKVNIFNDRLIQLMTHIIKHYNSSKEEARHTADALERMITREILDYKVQPDTDLMSLFEKSMNESKLQEGS